jgi:hypothetical protein
MHPDLSTFLLKTTLRNAFFIVFIGINFCCVVPLLYSTIGEIGGSKDALSLL